MEQIVERLLNSDEPSIRYKTLLHVLGADSDSAELIELREEIRDSPRVRTLLSEHMLRSRSGSFLRSYQSAIPPW